MTSNRLKSWHELVHLNDELRNGEITRTACGAT